MWEVARGSEPSQSVPAWETITVLADTVEECACALDLAPPVCSALALALQTPLKCPVLLQNLHTAFKALHVCALSLLPQRKHLNPDELVNQT